MTATVTNVEDVLPYEDPDPVSPFVKRIARMAELYEADSDFYSVAKEWDRHLAYATASRVLQTIAKSDSPGVDLGAEISFYAQVLNLLTDARLSASESERKETGKTPERKTPPAKGRRRKPSLRRLKKVGIRTEDALSGKYPSGEIDLAFTEGNSTQLIHVTDEDASVLAGIVHGYLQGRGHFHTNTNHTYWD